jgi:hypothetical protein
MRQAGLRFSMIGVDRRGVAHSYFQRRGYEETNVWATALARWETAHQPTRLRAISASPEGHDFVEQIYTTIAKEYLGFAWRHTPFERLRQISLSDIWVLRENNSIVGYALVHAAPTLLSITDLLLRPGIDAAEAVAAVAAELKSADVQVKTSRPVQAASFRRAGYHVAQPTWDGFLVKPLVPGVTVESARQLFGIGTDRFLISELDVP